MTKLDLELERAITELRGYCGRLARGRVTLTVEREDDETVAFYLDRDPTTMTDYERMMTQRPHKAREVSGCIE